MLDPWFFQSSWHEIDEIPSSSSSRSHLIVGSLRQTQFSSSQFCHGLHLVSCCPDSSHVSVDIVCPSLLRSSYSSSPRRNHLHSLSSDVLLVSGLVWSRLLTRFASLHLSVIFSTFSPSLLSSFLTWSLSVWPHAHLHIFNSVTSSFFTRHEIPIPVFSVCIFLNQIRHQHDSRTFFVSAAPLPGVW